jgi:DNA-binding MarR family transcriptional regulator
VDTDSLVRLRRVIGRLARGMNAGASGEGLTPSQSSVLGVVVARGPLGVRELSQVEGLNPTMLSRVIGKLDAAGLIKRTQDRSDLRVALVEATPAGVRVADRVRRRRTDALSACVDRLSPAHARALTTALPALEALVGELERDDSST